MESKPIRKSEQIASINKTAFLLVFVCTALVASLFIYHFKQPLPTRKQLATEGGILFDNAKEIGPFSLVSSHNQAFTENNLQGHWTLLFFGFTHCASICPLTLTLLTSIYPILIKDYPNLQVAFISLDPSRDSTQQLALYMSHFHPAFIGMSGKLQTLRKLQGELGIFSEQSPASTTGDIQLQHTASILLINPSGKWAGLFKYGLPPQIFVKSFREAITVAQAS